MRQLCHTKLTGHNSLDLIYRSTLIENLTYMLLDIMQMMLKDKKTGKNDNIPIKYESKYDFKTSKEIKIINCIGQNFKIYSINQNFKNKIKNNSIQG